MKHLIIVLTILLLYSCNLDNQSGKKKGLGKNTIQNPNLLIGEWGVYETISEGVEAKCNICPKISFKNDQTATVIFPSGETENLKWTASGNRLILTIIGSRNIAEIFPDSQYEMTFTQEKVCIKLELKQTEKKYSEILRR
ncbi:MAG: hypothetical protein NTZ69_00620 [Bacteroidia bacterium]|nr:hypothetical protein [Bacteroidia bacterium]